jgi:hypothetical protein
MIVLPDLRAWLKNHASENAELTLGRVDVKALSDELQRLQQGNDRLRKQNRKVRSKIAKLRAGEAVADDDDEADDLDPAGAGGDASPPAS